jgi:C_GCAxxG_C_C family probable redox protein
MKSLDMTKEEFMQKAYDLAAHNEVVFKGCSQAVVSAFQDLLGLKDILVLKAATAFAGGIGRQGATCGALTAGVMVIGMKYGRANLEDYYSFQRTFPPVLKLCSMFKQEFGSLNCHDITGVDFLDFEQMRKFYVSGRHDSECSVVAGKTARMVAGILYDMEEALLFDISKLEDVRGQQEKLV